MRERGPHVSTWSQCHNNCDQRTTLHQGLALLSFVARLHGIITERKKTTQNGNNRIDIVSGIWPSATNQYVKHILHHRSGKRVLLVFSHAVLNRLRALTLQLISFLAGEETEGLVGEILKDLLTLTRFLAATSFFKW